MEKCIFLTYYPTCILSQMYTKKNIAEKKVQERCHLLQLSIILMVFGFPDIMASFEGNIYPVHLQLTFRTLFYKVFFCWTFWNCKVAPEFIFIKPVFCNSYHDCVTVNLRNHILTRIEGNTVWVKGMGRELKKDKTKSQGGKKDPLAK